MFTGKTLSLASVSSDPADAGFLELRLDRADGSVNKLDAAAFDDLRAALDVIAAYPGLKGVLITSGKDAFVVGADIFEFTQLFAGPPEALDAVVARNGGTLTRLESLPVPVVAAIDGFALGGGLELALSTDVRVLADTAQVGLPEVTLGLIPGLGGTVRLPRLCGPVTAADWIASGRPQSAETALQAGVANCMTTSGRLRDSAFEILRAEAADPARWQARRARRRQPTHADAGVVTMALEDLLRTTRKRNPLVPAAGQAIELIGRASALDQTAGLVEERALFVALARTQAAFSLVRLFINDQAVKQQGKSHRKAGRSVGSAAVLGAGIMGGGIAYASAARGTPILMKDISQQALDLGMAEARKLSDKQVAAGRMGRGRADDILCAIRPRLDYAGFDAADIVVEAVVENEGVKKAVLAEVERSVRPEAILASNTSSLSITDLAGALERPGNFVGMHFFNPVPVMPLVEIIKGPQTTAAAAATAGAYALAMGKVPIVVKDCPGFLVNRIFTPYVLGFLQLVMDGADFEAVDRVAEAFGWPMGPAYLQDVIGMDTSSHVVRHITGGHVAHMAFPDRHPVSLMAEQGRLGQKSGLGFYRYEADDAGKPRRLPAADTRQLLSALQPHGTRAFEDEAILERLMLPMIIEAGRCLDEGIAGSPAEIDMALVLGLGFPRPAGGPLTYADWLGLDRVVAACGRHAALGPLYHPTLAMRDMAASGARFHAHRMPREISR